MKVVKLILVFLVLFGSYPLYAADQDALSDLLAVLDQETEIATKTKLNVDYVPGMVSVLYGQELLAKGYTRVFDALTSVPGIELSVSGNGQWQVMVRRVGKSFASAKVKVLLNGVAFNATLNAISNAIIMPLQLVDRIEVIRGPGSALHGEFASAGVINIVTHKNKSQAFAVYGSDDSLAIGAQSHVLLGKGIELSSSFSRYEKNSGDVQSGASWFDANPASVSPGKVNNSELHNTFAANVSGLGFEVNWQFVQRSLGDYFGMSNTLSGTTEPQRHMFQHGLDISRNWNQSGIDTRVSLGWLNYDLDSDPLYLFPAGTTFPWAASFPDGVIASPNYEEDRYYLGTESALTLDQHQLLLGVQFSRTFQGETFARRNYNLDAFGRIVNAPYQNYTGSQNWLKEDLSRKALSLYLQDQIALSDVLRLTAGVRYEDYSDVGSEVLPRLALVYNPVERHILKFQYARSFRPPTLMEMHVQNNAVVSGNPDLRSEIFENYELAYIYNDGAKQFRFTTFFYEVNDMIIADATSSAYQNQGELHTSGLELDLRSQLSRSTSVNAGFMYADNRSDEDPVHCTSNQMGNLGIISTIGNNLSVGANVTYVGKRTRQTTDSRSSLSDFKTVDLNLNAPELWHGLGLRLNVKNLFDETVRDAAPIVNGMPAYQGDYPRSGRSMMLQLDWKI